MRPYYFTFTTHAKGRWCGEKLSEVFAREFRALDQGEYSRCIERGLVKVNNEPSHLEYRQLSIVIILELECAFYNILEVFTSKLTKN